MIVNPLQLRAYDAVASALPFSISHENVTIRHGISYTRSPIKAHDFAAGVMAALASVTDHIGQQRGLGAQTMLLDRRRCGLLLNSAQMHFLNGYGVLLDTWPIGPDNGTYRTKDGRHITIIGLFPHLRDALLEYFQASNSGRSIQASAEKKIAQQLEDELAALSLPAGIVRSPDEWLAHPQGAETARHDLVDIAQIGTASSRKLGKAKSRPLEGVRVVELTHLVAGPTVGRLLAEQGAEVIAIQAPLGDWVLPLWLDVNWGKKSILLDIKGRYGNRRLTELLTGADVLVSSLRPGSLDRIGLDDAALRRLNPNLVYTNVAYSVASGPWKERRGFEQIAQAVTGMIHVHSSELEDPTLMSVLINDYMTGYLGAIGTTAALSEREAKGGFWKVHASLARCAMEAISLVEPFDAEQYAPVTMSDLIEHAVDCPSAWGTFTHLKPAIEYSTVPPAALKPPNIPGTDPDTTHWSDAPFAELAEMRHCPSLFARTGLIRNLISCHGIEDRGDGGGRLSLASKSLLKFVIASRTHDEVAQAASAEG